MWNTAGVRGGCPRGGIGLDMASILLPSRIYDVHRMEKVCASLRKPPITAGNHSTPVPVLVAGTRNGRRKIEQEGRRGGGVVALAAGFALGLVPDAGAAEPAALDATALALRAATEVRRGR